MIDSPRDGAAPVAVPNPPHPAGSSVASRFIVGADGLRLHVRDHRPAGAVESQALPLVCLHGLSRNADDFDVLAHTLASDDDAPRRVLAFETRGRGLSDHDADPQRYTLGNELADVLAMLTAMDVTRAVVLGTSRGGLLAMMLAAHRPAVLAGVILNDIGPVIEPQGFARIKGYVGRLPRPRDMDEAADTLRRLFDGQFPRLGPTDWRAWAQRTFREESGRLVARYDPRLAATLADVDLEQPLPSLWPAFDSLAGIPLMVVRGANSDLLAAGTVTSMRARRRDLISVEVPDQGHAPLLVEADIIGRIAAFAMQCDSAS